MVGGTPSQPRRAVTHKPSERKRARESPRWNEGGEADRAQATEGEATSASESERSEPDRAGSLCGYYLIIPTVFRQ